MTTSRREALAGLAAVLATWPLTAVAAGSEVAPSPNVARIQDALLGFDLRTVARAIRADLSLPARWDAEIDALFEGVTPGGGLRRLAELGDDSAFRERVDDFVERESGRLSTQLLARRMVRALPEDPATMTAWAEVASRWVGLDLPAMRSEAAALPEGLLVVVGPATSVPELVGALLREPFVRFLELVHGRRAREWVSGSPRRDLLEALLDPTVRVVCTVGHGSWDELSLTGLSSTPETAYTRVRQRLRDEPRTYVPHLLSGNLWSFELPYGAAPLRERDLAELVSAWFPDEESRAAAAKDLVVRHTCGTARWRVKPALAATLLPAELGEALHVGTWGLAPRRPGTDPASWPGPLQAWLDTHRVQLEPTVAFGACLVRDPADTRGYDGLSWLPDFVADPIPGPAVPWRPATPSAAAEE